MVDHQIHDQFHAPTVNLLEQLVKVLHCTVVGMNRPVVADVIAVVIHRAGVDRREPEGGDPQLLQIGQPAADAIEIPDPIPA